MSKVMALDEGDASYMVPTNIWRSWAVPLASICLVLTLALAGCGGGNDMPVSGSAPNGATDGPTGRPQTDAVSSTPEVKPATTESVRPDRITPTPTSSSSKTDSTSRSAVDTSTVTITGLLATIPEYTSVNADLLVEIAGQAFPDRIPRSVQLLLVITEDGKSRLIVALDTLIDRFITAGTVVGQEVPLPSGFPSDLNFAGGIVISNDITLLEPMRATPEQVNSDPERFAFKRVVMDTSYVFGGVRIKKAPPSLDHIGFGVAFDKFGSEALNDYLTVVDPYNTEAQIRVADLVGTVLYPTDNMRLLLGQLYRFSPDDVEASLGKPAIFYEQIVDDEAQLLNIQDLVPTPADPSLKLDKYHGEVVSVQGLALGAMMKSEDLPILNKLPIAVTAKVFGIADLTGAMPVFGISSEDTSGEVFGFFRFDLSVYRFEDGEAHAFLIGREAVPLDPVEEVSRAEFGDRVKASLEGYLVTEADRIQLADDLTLEQTDLLLPSEIGKPIIMTRHENLKTGDFLTSVSFDGYLIDGQILGVPGELTTKYGAGIIIVDAASLSFVRGLPPVPGPLG